MNQSYLRNFTFLNVMAINHINYSILSRSPYFRVLEPLSNLQKVKLPLKSSQYTIKKEVHDEKGYKTH